MKSKTYIAGFTLVEMLIAVLIMAMMLAGLAGIANQARQSEALTRERNELYYQANFAMERMVRAVARTSRVMVPMTDKLATNWREHVREETVPPSPPEGDSSKATAVLALTLDLVTDMDSDGFIDADNDKDGLVDEDMPADMNYDFGPGVYLIDDDGNGIVDDFGFFSNYNDDETPGANDEDPINGSDDDGDGVIDEDPGGDVNADFAPGIAGVDDDGDGSTDEGSNQDDDEDGVSNEDWCDTVVYYLNGSDLIERLPVPWDESGGGQISGRDFVESVIAENVTLLRIERVPLGGSRTEIVDLTLDLTSASGLTASLNTRVRIGAAR